MPATPEDVTKAWSAAYNRSDLDAIVALYEPSGVLTTRTGEARTGHDEIRAHFAAQLTRVQRMTTAVRKVVRNGDLALCYGDWTAHLTNPDGTPREVSGHSVELVRRQPDGTWRYVLDDPFPGDTGAR